jgi:hypothetical protein
MSDERSKDKSETYNIQISLKEIDAILCPKCKKKLRELIKSKLPEEVIEKLVFK